MFHLLFITLLNIGSLHAAETLKTWSETEEKFYSQLYDQRKVEISWNDFIQMSIKLVNTYSRESLLFRVCIDNIGVRNFLTQNTESYRQALLHYFEAYSFYLIQPHKYPFRPLPKGQALLQSWLKLYALNEEVKKIHANSSFSHYATNILSVEQNIAQQFVEQLSLQLHKKSLENKSQ